MNQINWVRTLENRIFRADTLIGFEIRNVQQELLAQPPGRTMGGPKGRQYEIVGIFDVCGKRDSWILAGGYASLDKVDEVINDFLAALEGTIKTGIFIHEIPKGP